MSLLSRIKSKLKHVLFAPEPQGLTKEEIKRLIAKQDPIIFEIGCANGDDTLAFLDTFADTNIKLYGFEPEPKNIGLLEERVHSDRFELFKGAVSDTDGEISFNRSRTDNPEDLSLSGSIMKPKNHLKMWDWIHFDEQVSVPTVTLDTFAKNKNLDVIDFIWCDVQGAEERVILGGLDTLNNKVRYLFTEYSNDEQYEGQPTLERILELLPAFEVAQHHGADVLLKNKNL